MEVFSGGEIGFDCIYNQEKWDFVAKEQGVHVWDQGTEITERRHQAHAGRRGILAKPVEDEEPDQISRVSR